MPSSTLTKTNIPPEKERLPDWLMNSLQPDIIPEEKPEKVEKTILPTTEVSENKNKKTPKEDETA